MCATELFSKHSFFEIYFLGFIRAKFANKSLHIHFSVLREQRKDIERLSELIALNDLEILK